MIIIGEKINGTRKAVARAIKERDEAFIRELAIAQAEARVRSAQARLGCGAKRRWRINVSEPAITSPNFAAMA